MTVIDWAQLHHAYGSATDIPALLVDARHASASDRSDAQPWHALWSALCHQDDVYPASYAAVPELVRIAEERRDSGGIEALLLAAAIELQRHGPGAPTVPDALYHDYLTGIARGGALAEALRGLGDRPDDGRRLAIAAAVFSGDFAQARLLFGDTDEE